MKEKKVNRFHNLLTFLRPHKGGLSVPYPINSRGSYPYNTSYHDDVIERDMFWYFIKKKHIFLGRFVFQIFVPSVVCCRTALLLLFRSNILVHRKLSWI